MDSPMPTVTANSFEARPGGAIPLGIVAASLVASGYGERPGQTPRAMDIESPLATQVAGGTKAVLVAAFLAQHNGGPRAPAGARSLDEPVSTITTTGSQQGLAAVTLGRLRGSDAAGQPVDAPMPTQTAGGSHAALILGFLQHYYSSGGQDQGLADPLGAVTGKARHGLVTGQVGRTTYVIDDIRMRMLEPEEGAAAHGFPRGALPAEITIAGKTRRLTKTEKYHLVGNSVPPRMVQLLAALNVRRELAAPAHGGGPQFDRGATVAS